MAATTKQLIARLMLGVMFLAGTACTGEPGMNDTDTTVEDEPLGEEASE